MNIDHLTIILFCPLLLRQESRNSSHQFAKVCIERNEGYQVFIVSHKYLIDLIFMAKMQLCDDVMIPFRDLLLSQLVTYFNLMARTISRSR